MPVSLSLHHALADGLHAGRFFENFQRELDQLKRLSGRLAQRRPGRRGCSLPRATVPFTDTRASGCRPWIPGKLARRLADPRPRWTTNELPKTTSSAGCRSWPWPRFCCSAAPSGRSAGLEPAAPAVERAGLWIDTASRGPFVREVRGNGTLVPELARWVAAPAQGQVERILVEPGATRRRRHRAAGARPTPSSRAGPARPSCRPPPRPPTSRR